MPDKMIARIFLIAALLCALCFGALAEDVYSIGYYTENGKTIAYTDVSGAMTSALYAEMIASVQSGSTLSTITVLEGGSLNAGSNTVSADVVNQGTISGGTYEYLINHGTMTSGTVNELHNYGTVTGGVLYTVYNYAEGVIDGRTYKDDGDWYNALDFAGPITNYGEILASYDVRSGAELVVNEGTTYVRVYGNSYWGYDDGGYCWDIDDSYYAMTGFQTVGEVLGHGYHAYGGEYAYDMPLQLSNTLYKQWGKSNGVLTFKGCTSVSNVPVIPYKELADVESIVIEMGLVKFESSVNVPVTVKNTYCGDGAYYDSTIEGGTFNAGITFIESGKINNSSINCEITMQKAGQLTNCTYGSNAKILITGALQKSSNAWGGITWPTTYDCPVEITATGSVSACTFNGTVTNYGTITNGSYTPTFYGRVNNYGTISGGSFKEVYGSGAIEATVSVSTTSLSNGHSVNTYLMGIGARRLTIDNAKYQWYWDYSDTATGAAMTEATSDTYLHDYDGIGYVYPVITIGSTKLTGPRVALVVSGTCGTSNNINWRIAGTSMGVSGSGEMPDYTGYNETPWYDYARQVTSLTIYEGVTRVGKCCFDSFNKLTSLSLPESLRSIGGYGFYGLYVLESVTLPSRLETLDYSAFSTCYGLKSIVIPDSVTTMNETAFCNNTSLTSVTLSKNLKTIPTSAFNNTPMLKRVVIPDGVETIMNRAFSYGGLEHITIPTSVTSISSAAFEGREGQVTIACHADSAAAVFAETYGYPAEVEPHTETTLEAVAPTCTEPGLTEGVSCLVCAYAIIPQEELPAAGHMAVVDEAVEPTCTETGLTEGSHCETCGITLTEQSEVPALGHTEVVDEAVDPTCSESGLTEGVHCETCGEVIIAQEIVDTLPHTEVVIEGFAATCTEPGVSDEIFCSECGESIQFAEEIPALGHSDSITLEAVAPTCTEAGRTAEHKCAVCGVLLAASETVAATGHTEVVDAAVDPTCTLPGLTAGSHCETCLDVLIAQETIPALGHTVVVTPGVPPTCTEPGLADGEHCSVCGETIAEQVEIPAAHTPATDPAVEPTDYDSGLTEGSHCSACGEVLVAQEIIPANFTWDGTTVTAYNRDNTDIVIPDGATALGNTLFKNNTTITSVTIPDSVTVIGTHTFFGCTGLTDVYLPENITTLSGQSFYNANATFHVGAQSATAVALSFRKIPFTTADGYTLLYKVTSLTGTPSEAYLIRYTGSETELSIPAAFGGAPLREIRMTAFADNYAITSVVIPDSVTVLGAGAFHGCGNLSSVTIPDGVTAIEATTFAACFSLHSIDLPDNLTSIGTYAFSACPLTSIDIPDSVTTIDEAAFINTSSLITAKLPAGLTAIPNQLFSGSTLLKSVTIPEKVTSIGDSAFFMCESITEMIVPEGVTSIGSNAFSGCTKLSSLYLPSTLTTLGDEVFSYLSSLSQIVLPDNITSVGTDLLKNTSATLYCNSGTVTAQTLSAAGYNYSPLLTIETVEKADGSVDVIVTDCANFVSEIVVPEGVTKIGDSAFQSCEQLRSITLPSTLTAIGQSAFRWCSTLESIVIPDSVQTIGAEAFMLCSNLVSVALPKNLTVIDHDLFQSCEQLTTVNLPENLLSIGDNAFYDTQVAFITLPESVRIVGRHAFGSTACESIFLPDNIETMGDYAFTNKDASLTVTLTVSSFDCRTAAALNDPDLYYSYRVEGVPHLTFGGRSDENGETHFALLKCDTDAAGVLTIPDCVTMISDMAFMGCYSLTEIHLPENVTALTEYSIYGGSGTVYLPSIDCPTAFVLSRHRNFHVNEYPGFGFIALKDEAGEPVYHLVSYNGSETNVVVPDFITVMESTFSHNSTVTSVTLPEGVTTIGDDTFFCCSALTTVNLPESVTSIGIYAFNECTSLTSISIPDSVTSLGKYAFYRCTSLTDVTLGSGLTVIDKHTFCDCTSLETVAFGENITSIGESAFSGCDALKHVALGSSVTTIGDSAFYSCDRLQSVTASDSLTTVGDNAFTSCGSLETVHLGDGLTTLGSSAFNSCDALKEMTFGGNLSSIGSSCFSFVPSSFAPTVPSLDCTSVLTLGAKGLSFRTAEYPNLNLKVMTDENGDTVYAVTGCDPSVTEIIVPEFVTVIGDYAFDSCSALAEIDLHGHVKTLGSSAFSYGTLVYLPGFDCASAYTLSSKGYAYALRACPNLRFKSYAEDASVHLTAYTGDTNSVAVPEGVTAIDEYAFQGNKTLTAVTLPESLTTIGHNAFHGCGLTALHIPSGVTEIGESAFESCSKLMELTGLENVVTIGNRAFYGCSHYVNGQETGFMQLPLGNKLKTIGDYAFGACRALTSLTIPDSVVSIGVGAFSYCTDLMEVNIGSGLTELPSLIFKSCMFPSILIPDTITSIAADAFANFNHLGMYIRSSANAYARTWAAEHGHRWEHDVHDEQIIPGVPATHLTEGLTDAVYCPGCETFVAEPTTIPVLSLPVWTLPKSLTAIEAEAFMQVPAQIIELPEGCERIGSRAFAENATLKVVLIPGSVTEIDASAFDGCAEDLVILADEGSAAHMLAAQNGMLFVIR